MTVARNAVELPVFLSPSPDPRPHGAGTCCGRKLAGGDHLPTCGPHGGWRPWPGARRFRGPWPAPEPGTHGRFRRPEVSVVVSADLVPSEAVREKPRHSAAPLGWFPGLETHHPGLCLPVHAASPRVSASEVPPYEDTVTLDRGPPAPCGLTLHPQRTCLQIGHIPRCRGWG